MLDDSRADPSDCPKAIFLDNNPEATELRYLNSVCRDHRLYWFAVVKMKTKHYKLGWTDSKK